jgi:hypothetical protein
MHPYRAPPSALSPLPNPPTHPRRRVGFVSAGHDMLTPRRTEGIRTQHFLPCLRLTYSSFFCYIHCAPRCNSFTMLPRHSATLPPPLFSTARPHCTHTLAPPPSDPPSARLPFCASGSRAPTHKYLDFSCIFSFSWSVAAGELRAYPLF